MSSDNRLSAELSLGFDLAILKHKAITLKFGEIIYTENFF